MTKQIIDIDSWERKEHYQFFSQFDEPFFGITAKIDCTVAYKRAKADGFSFFLYCLHKSIQTVNQYKPFRLRIEDGNAVLYDIIHPASTIESTKGLFSFCFLEYREEWDDFLSNSKEKISQVREIGGLGMNDENRRIDVIHYSSIPWIKFTALSHARNFSIGDSVPKITFGKFHQQNNRLLLPVSINAHHGLMDGFHVGEYLTLFQENMNRF